jgi:hypothetical protein
MPLLYRRQTTTRFAGQNEGTIVAAWNARLSNVQSGFARTIVHSFASIVKKWELGPRPGVPKKRHAGTPDADPGDQLLNSWPVRRQPGTRTPASSISISAGSAVTK